ncbi:MAG: exosortase/archaeosortase family protein [Dehalococcoidia bacterium]
MGFASKRNIAQVFAFLAITAGIYYPAIDWLVDAWLGNDYYNHGFFLLAFSVFLVWLSRKRLREAIPDRQHRGLPALIFALSLYLAGFLTGEAVVLSFSLIFFIAALCLQFLGWQRTRLLLFPIFLPALAIPIPSFYEFGIWLQDVSASGASGFSSLLGMDVSSNGNDITVGGETYHVAPACSGLNRVMPLFSLTAIIAYILEGAIWKKMFLLALVIPFALFSNIVRITITLWAGSTWGADVAMSFFHDFSSIVLFLVAVIMIVLTAFLLGILQLRRGIIP